MQGYSAPVAFVNNLLAYATNMLAVAATGPAPSLRRMAFEAPRKTTREEAREMGEALKSLRTTRGLTQQEAADAAGVTRTAWQNYEGGRPVILRTDMQAKLARACGAERGELLMHLSSLQRGQRHSSEPPEPAPDAVAPGRQQARFPLAQGEVVLTFPAGLTAEGFAELADYMALFLRNRTPPSA
jgi:transcriptional regulator with XRE-family HTH domain